MLVPLLAARALATVPEGRTELVGDIGILQGQPGVAAGLGAGWRGGPLVVTGFGTVAARTGLCAGGICVFPGGSRNPASGTWSLATALDTETGAVRLGVVALVDGAILDVAEEQCLQGQGCRHDLWLDHPSLPVGASFAPAGGLRISGVGASGTRFAMTLAIQPTLFRDIWLPLAPRVDLVVDVNRDLSLHWWMGRYGSVVGLGYRLSRPTEGAR